MAVFRIERTRDYTVMSNHHLRNANLSLKAKGLLSMMLSLPEDWNYTTRGLAKICKEGVDAIGAALRELEAAGYIVRHKLRDSQGRISDTEYVIYEQPQLRKPDTDSPDTENPYMDKPDTEKPAGLNIEKSNTQKQNIYGSSTDSIPFRDCAADCLPERKGRDAMSLTEIESYGEKWLLMQSAKVSASTLRGYTRDMTNYIIKPLGEMYMEEVTADDIRLALVPLSKKSEGLYNKVNMLLKCIFYAAERNQILEHNPCAGISGKGGKPTKKKEALTDQQVAVLLDTVKGLPPYLFIMLGLYSGLRREEILALQWDCVFLDEDTPYLSVRRAWRTEHNRPVVSTVLKTPAAKRDIPIPKCLVDCLRETKENSISDYVIADSKGEPLAASQFQRVWQYVVVRSTKPRNYYKYVNGESIKYTVTPTLGMTQKNQPKIKYTLDFDVTPHQLRHTYITNLLYAGVDPKTVQYLAGHENSKTTMDIYAKVKYNKPEELFGVVNGAFHQAIAE